jgi:DNA primase catalytic subunit
MAGEHVTHDDLERTEKKIHSHIDSKLEIMLEKVVNQNERQIEMGQRFEKLLDFLVIKQSETDIALATHKTYWKLSGAVMLAVLSGLVALTVAVLS